MGHSATARSVRPRRLRPGCFARNSPCDASFSMPEGIGALVAFLCSEAATMTGAAVVMDGGWASV